MKREMRRQVICFLFVPVFCAITAALANAADVKVYAFHAGILRTQTQYMLKDTRVGTPMDIPVLFLVIKHGKEWVAFDTGCNAQAAKDPVGYWGEAIAKAYTPVIKPQEEFKEAIKILGLKPGDFKAVLCSHGHLDHAGAIDNFVGTNVPIYFQKSEMAEIRKIVDAQTAGTPYVLGDFRHLNELNIQEVEGLWDVFGDQSVIAFPTRGHTLGHQSLYVKPSKGRPFIYCADAMYTLENMEKSIPLGLAADAPGAIQNIQWFQLEEWTGVKIVPSHDPEYWKQRALAPKEFVP